MKQILTLFSRTATSAIVLGIVIIAATLIVYDRIIANIYSTSSISWTTVDEFAYATLVLYVLGLGICIYGLYKLLSQSDAIGNFWQVFRKLVLSNRYRTIILLVSSLYALFFAIVSGILVYQSEPMSIEYGVHVPSVSIALCCGTLGQVPVFVFYLTQNIGLVITPVNILLIFGISLLVGVNVGLFLYSHDEKKQSIPNKNWPSILGTCIGLFTACPNCTGLFISSMVGLSGAFTLLAAYSWFQPTLIIVGIVCLLTGPLLIARTSSLSNSCASQLIDCQIQKPHQRKT